MTATTPASARWKKRPPGSNWGEFGPDDQRGRINLLTPQKVLQGMAEVREGLAFCLSLPLDLPGGSVLNPRRHPPVLRPTLREGKPNFNCDLGGDYTDVVCDDLVVMHLQYSTQWDSFAHVGSLFDANGDGRPEHVFYNGFRGGEDIVGPADAKDAGVPAGPGGGSTSRAGALGIENMASACVQGRGVMIDLHAHFGRERKLVRYDDLMQVMAADHVTVEPGDLVCFHTGFGQMLMDGRGKPDPHDLHHSCPVLDGRDAELLQWVTDSGAAVLIADNYGVEDAPARRPDGMQPGDCCASLPLHEHCLFKLGVHLGEMFYLTPLAAWLREHGRNRFLLTAPPLRLPGAVGSPATPVATV